MNTILGSPNLQIYNNATFIESLPLQPISQKDPNLDDFVKENQDPNDCFAQFKKPVSIDEEIVEMEREITRLSKKLEALKIKKIQQSGSKTPASVKRGRIVPAKFLNVETAGRKIQESRQRGFSLGPGDIYGNATPFRAQKLNGVKEEKGKEKNLATPGSKKVQEARQRRFSLGPRDIYETAIPACTQKLNVIKEEKEKNSVLLRRRGMSVGPMEIHRQTRLAQEAKREKNVCMTTSPKSRKPMMKSNVSSLRNGIATVGAKKSVKIDEGLVMGVKPKTLFGETKRPLKTAKFRIVPSRYSLTNASNEESNKRRKWSLPEDEEKNNEARRKRCQSLGGANFRETRVEISSSPKSVMKINEGLPKIKTLRCVDESPRDSGCAKRIADLVGKKCGFDELELGSSCQSLKFDDGEN